VSEAFGVRHEVDEDVLFPTWVETQRMCTSPARTAS
jgi:hypothetical protein